MGVEGPGIPNGDAADVGVDGRDMVCTFPSGGGSVAVADRLSSTSGSRASSLGRISTFRGEGLRALNGFASLAGGLGAPNTDAGVSFEGPAAGALPNMDPDAGAAGWEDGGCPKGEPDEKLLLGWTGGAGEVVCDVDGADGVEKSGELKIDFGFEGSVVAGGALADVGSVLDARGKALTGAVDRAGKVKGFASGFSDDGPGLLPKPKPLFELLPKLLLELPLPNTLVFGSSFSAVAWKVCTARPRRRARSVASRLTRRTSRPCAARASSWATCFCFARRSSISLRVIRVPRMVSQWMKNGWEKLDLIPITYERGMVSVRL